MASTLFPALPAHSPQPPALAAVQAQPLALSPGGTLLFGGAIHTSFRTAFLRLNLEASFTGQLTLSLECPGKGAYAWALSALPGEGEGTTAFSCAQTLTLRGNGPGGGPALSAPFPAYAAETGLRCTLPDLTLLPASPVPLAGNAWAIRLSAAGGQVLAAWLETA